MLEDQGFNGSYLNEGGQNNVLVYLVRRKDRYFLEVSE
jgi:hypothetical protein